MDPNDIDQVVLYQIGLSSKKLKEGYYVEMFGLLLIAIIHALRGIAWAIIQTKEKR